MSMTFRKRSWAGTILSQDERARQGRVVNAALAALGNVEALAFLNRHHDDLGGRPIDLAVASDAGLAAVEALLGAPPPAGRREREALRG